MQGMATWTNNQVVWHRYSDFADTFDLLNTWQDMYRGGLVLVFKNKQSLQLTQEIVASFFRTRRRTFTRLFHNANIVRKTTWDLFNISEEYPANGHIEFCTPDGDPINLSRYDELTLEEMNNLPFQYTFKDFRQGGMAEMDAFIGSFTSRIKNEAPEGAAAAPDDGAAAAPSEGAAPRRRKIVVGHVGRATSEKPIVRAPDPPPAPVDEVYEGPPAQGKKRQTKRRVNDAFSSDEEPSLESRKIAVVNDAPIDSPVSDSPHSPPVSEQGSDADGGVVFDSYIGSIIGTPPAASARAPTEEDEERVKDLLSHPKMVELMEARAEELLRDPKFGGLLDARADAIAAQAVQHPMIQDLLDELAREKEKSERLIAFIKERVPDAQEELAKFQFDESQDSVRMARIEQNITMLLSTLKK
jgi:hypothetical protein